MSVKQFAKSLREEVQAIKDQGVASIYCENLIKYLTEVENSPEPETTPLALEEAKARLQQWVVSNQYQHESSIEMFRSVIASGQNALRTSFVLNGGACVALLAFIGHLAQFNTPAVPIFANALFPFVIALIAISLTSGLTYIGQSMYAHNHLKWGDKVKAICIILGFSSAVFFCWGVLILHSAFQNYA